MPAREQYVFGPVPSRRLGRSLGVDLVPFKTCTYNCIYCQLGPTTNLTIQRGEFVPISSILCELEAKLAAGAAPDYITLSGSGEPTLQKNLDELIAGIKRLTNQPVAVLTNGSLLWRDDVQSELLSADLVIPSLDAGSEEMFRRVNRPHADLHFEQVAEGLVRFRRRFRGRFWLEVFLLAGLTAGDDEVLKIKALADELAPDRIQLNTVARPPTEMFAKPASIENLLRATMLLGERAEVIAEHRLPGTEVPHSARSAEIIALLQRRPCTLDDLAAGLGTHRLEVAKLVEQLVRKETIAARQHDQRVYYRVSGHDAERNTGDRPPSEAST